MRRFHRRRHDYLGNHPKEKNLEWSGNTNGIAHDDDYWYITTEDTLYKIPVSHDLGQDIGNSVVRVGIPGPLAALGMDHFGDLDHCDGFLFVPMTASAPILASPVNPVVAVFRSTELKYLGFAHLYPQTGAGWCAIHPQTRVLYSSNNTLGVADTLSCFAIDWNDLRRDPPQVVLEKLPEERIGVGIPLRNMQGGAFSPDGILYLCHGYMQILPTDHNLVDRDYGIKFFQFCKTGWVRIGESTQDGEFRFQFRQNLPYQQEPEGLTWWDLDPAVEGEPGRAPGIEGQLHVLLLDNEAPDKIYLKHYRYRDEPLVGSDLKVFHAHEATVPILTPLATDVVGLARDGEAWIIADRRRLLRLTSIDQDEPEAMVDVPDESIEYGDPTVVEGVVLVPLRGGTEREIGFYRASDLKLIGRQPLDHVEDITWCAYSEERGLLRSSGQKITHNNGIHGHTLELSHSLLFPGDMLGFLQDYADVHGGAILPDAEWLYLAIADKIYAFNKIGEQVTVSGGESRSFRVEGRRDWIKGKEVRGLWIDKPAIEDPWAIAGRLWVLTLDKRSGRSLIYCFRIEEPQFLANFRSKEVHTLACWWGRNLDEANLVSYLDLDAARADGYDGCYHCLHGFSQS
jgi:hypothetical protein